MAAMTPGVSVLPVHLGDGEDHLAMRAKNNSRVPGLI